jgi:hypothetical protein
MATQKKKYFHSLNEIWKEDYYLYNLRSYLNNETDKSELDFLEQHIKIFENDIKDKKTHNDALLKITEKEHRESILNGDLPNYRNIEDWINAEIRKRKKQKNITNEVSILKILYIRLNRLPKPNILSQTKENPYPNVFREKENFLVFSMYLDRHFVKPYKDISFIYQQIKRNKGILIKHLEFAKFLKDERFITEKNYIEIENKKGFDNKSDGEERVNNYYKIIKDIEDFK